MYPYELTEINNVTRNTGVYTLHTVDIYTVHISLTALLQLSTYSPTFLHISLEKQQTVAFISHPNAIYILVTDMPIKCHIYAINANQLTCIYRGNTLNMYTTYEVTCN